MDVADSGRLMETAARGPSPAKIFLPHKQALLPAAHIAGGIRSPKMLRDMAQVAVNPADMPKFPPPTKQTKTLSQSGSAPTRAVQPK
eukprot:374427-Prymnesium_polylepis.1